MSQQSFTVTMTNARYKTLAEKLLAEGILAKGATSGTFPRTLGVELDFVVKTNPDMQSVSVVFTILSKPIYLRESAIEEHIRQMIRAES